MALKVKKLSKSFNQGAKKVEVLKDLDLVVDSGDSVAIIGRSGSGKSTLLTLLAGLDRSDGGNIEVGSTLLEGLKQGELAQFRAKNIGIIFQHYHLIESLNVLENVVLPLEIQRQEHAYQAAHRLIDQVGLAARKNHFPHQLSGGERQRVAIARAIITKPCFLLADEPSGSLDVQTGAEVMDILFDMLAKHKMTLLLVTHDPVLAQRCQKIYRLENGKLIQHRDHQ